MEAAEQLHATFHHLRFAAHWVTAGNEVAYFLELGNACTAIAELFKELIGQPCRACVKIVSYVGDTDDIDWTRPDLPAHLMVETEQRSYAVHYVADKDGPIPVTQSSAFESFWPPFGQHWFVVHDIEAAYRDGWYKNPTRRQGTPRPDYNSSMVWPVQIDLRHLPSPGCHFRVFGYLAVDSLATNVFTDSHGWIGAGIADACFTALNTDDARGASHGNLEYGRRLWSRPGHQATSR